jgi:hypothetical protein
MTDNITNMNDENMNDQNKKEEKRKGIYKKDDKYAKEQKEILERVNNILGITESNNKFIVEEIDIARQKQIKKYIKYFYKKYVV